jgi:hypothetical protein
MQIAKNILIFLLAFICAFVALSICNSCIAKQPEFWQISFRDILQLSMTLFIAFFIAHHLRNRYSDKQIQKNLFLEITNDIAKILANESDFLREFMQQFSRAKSDKIKVILLLKKISNKITVLETYSCRLDDNTKKLVARLRGYFDIINQIVAGEDDFIKAESFSDDSINKVLKNTFDIIFVLDQIKLNLFH